MEKLPMCRICLVENVRMFVVNNKNLHELYKKLTDIPFVTEDRRPILACVFCCTKLKQCCRLLRKCLEAEEQFAQMMNEDYEPNPLTNQERLESYSGFIKSPIELMSIVDECQTESIAIKEELPAVCEGLDDIIEPNEGHQSDELESENIFYGCLDVADIPSQHSESDLEDDVPLMEFRIEVEEVCKKKQTARETKELESENIFYGCLDVADIPSQHSESDLEDDVPLIKFKTDVEEEVSKKKRTVRETNSEIKRPLQQYSTQCCNNSRATEKRKFNLESYPTNSKTYLKPGTYYKEPYKCDQRSFNQKSRLTNNIRIHTDEKPYKCDVCQSSFSRNYYLTRHIRIHTGEKPYECDVCQRSFSHKSNLTKHILMHTGEKPFKCHVFPSSFNRNYSLTKHIRTHAGENPYKCDVCQRSFTQRSSLTNHIRIHTGEKPYECDICQHSFIRRYYLIRHIRVHTGEKPYKCDECQRSFSQKSSLINHIRIHTREKPYKCHVCERSFIEKGVLTKHIRIHTGEKPYKCYLCQRGFFQNRDLKNHIRIHTGE